MKNRSIVVFFAMLTLLLGSCKGKRSFAERVADDKRESPPTEAAEVRRYEGAEVSPGLMRPLPADDGVFKKFEIGSVEEYITTFASIAQDEMIAFGIPASITLAQGILESGAGQGMLTRKSNNHFGIKCHTDWDGGRVYHDDDEAGECFRKYNHPMYSFRDHSVFLTSRARYSSLFDYSRNDYRSWAYGLKKAGYATDPNYPQKLIRLIQEYKLYQYDQEMVDRGLPLKRVVKPRETIRYVVRQGDTLYSISQRYFVTVDELKEWNRLDGSTIDIGQELTIEVENK